MYYGYLCPVCGLPTDTLEPCPDCSKCTHVFTAKQDFEPLGIETGDFIIVARSGAITNIVRPIGEDFEESFVDV